MKILNIMLSRNLGGIQQAFLDYHDALSQNNFQVINITSLGAEINNLVASFKLPNLGPWDIFSVIYLKILIWFNKPDIIIAHGNRAIKFALLARSNNNVQIVTIAHNYTMKWLLKCDYIIALTTHMQNFLTSNNYPPARILLCPNMIRINQEFKQEHYHTPVRIGMMARFVKKKGIDVALHALADLKERGYQFKTIIGGDGEEKQNLLTLVNKLNLQNMIEFVGWVKSRKDFFTNCDIFCLPSLHEPFGIIVLEAMMHSKPLVATKTEGPVDIINNEMDGLLCEIASSKDLADKIAKLIDNEKYAHKLANAAFLKLQQNYDINIVAKTLINFLNKIKK